MRDLFLTKEDKEIAVANFKSLLSHPGWKQVEMILDQSIEKARFELENGVKGETIQDIELNRQNIEQLRWLKNIPSSQINKFEPAPVVSPVYDPYSTVYEVSKEREEINK